MKAKLTLMTFAMALFAFKAALAGVTIVKKKISDDIISDGTAEPQKRRARERGHGKVEMPSPGIPQRDASGEMPAKSREAVEQMTKTAMPASAAATRARK